MKNNIANIPLDSNEDELTPVQQFYYGKSVFITGVSGLLGKVLLEKLLRSCPGIERFYVMMRSKRSVSAKDRLDKILDLELFDIARKSVPIMKQKITIVSGELEKPRLGMSDEDIETLKANVHIIFHVAGCVNFLEKLKKVMELNVGATKELITISKECQKLEAFVYVSTIYANRTKDFVVPEWVGKSTVSPSLVLDTVEWLDDEAVMKITPNIIGDKATNYLFSKHMAEKLILEMKGDQTMAIVRPSVVISTYDDPFPGWIDALQSLVGILLAVGKGFLRCAHLSSDMKVDVIPADRVISTVITTAWYSATKRKNDILVVNCTLGDMPSYENLTKVLLTKERQFPLVEMYRLPSLKIHHSYPSFLIHAIFAHYIPGIIGDIILYIFTGKTLLLRLYWRIEFINNMYIRLSREPWNFETNNLHAIKDSLSVEDSKIFNMDTKNVDWEKYLEDSVVQGRKFIAHEDPSTLPYARKKAKIWYAVTTVLQWGLIIFFLNYFFGSYIF